MNDNIIDKPNAAKLNFLKATAERSFYLDRCCHTSMRNPYFNLSNTLKTNRKGYR